MTDIQGIVRPPQFIKSIKYLSVLALLAAAVQSWANTVVWTAGSGTDTNWSDGANWSGGSGPGGSPAGGDDVKFFNAGTNAAAGVPTSQVDTSFAGYIGSLQYGSTNGYHTTYVTNGQTLYVTNTGGVYVGTAADIGVAYTNRATITGAGGALNVNNTNANISLAQGTATGVNFEQSILDLSGLGNFTANVSRIGIGSQYTANPGNAVQREAGTLILAMTNFITVNYAMPVNSYLYAASTTNAIELQRNAGNNAGSTTPSTLLLGITNVINVDSIGCGRDKSDASCLGRIMFNPAILANNPVANIYGAGGVGTRVNWYSIGDAGPSGSSSHGGYGTNDFTGGTINIFANYMSLGRDCTATTSWAGPNKGTLTYTAGTIDVNNLILGNQSLLLTGSSTPPNVGVMNMNGAGTLLRVNNNLAMGYTTNAADAAAANSYGSLNVNGGTVYANNITVGAASTIASMQITLTNATLIVSNTMATNATGLATFNMTNSTLGLTASSIGNPVAFVKSMNLAGATNHLQLTVPVYSSYPQTVPLIKYTALIGTFNLGMSSVPASAPNASLMTVAGSPNVLELVLPTDPRPVITAQPSPYGGSPGDNVLTNFVVQISAGSVTPITYQWYFVTNGVTNILSSTTGPSGLSTLSGMTTTNLQISNAQPGDSGNYFMVAMNAYGTNTSILTTLIISPTPIMPIVTGPASVTVTNGVTGMIVNSVIGDPIPIVYWQYNGAPLHDGTGPSGSSTISGTSGTSITIANPQYPGDQGTYSLIASNSVGLTTNNTVLSVIVAPQITSQPVSLVVTNTQAAAFSVTATGVPTPAYQWYFNSVQISGATSSIYSIPSVSSANTGNYYCVITNQAGTTNTVTVSLTVNSTMAVTTFVPANSATGICYDTPLYLTFNATPVLRNAGNIKVYNVTNSSTPVVTINLALNANGVQQRANFQGDSQGFNYYPVIITGNTAAVYLYTSGSGILTSNQTYYVTIDDGVFADSAGAYYAGISGNTAWRFTTKPGGPIDTNNLFVAQDNSGDFATVQGAVDSVASANTTPHVIHIKNGFYEEIVDISGKNNLTFFGQSRAGAMVGYPNNAGIATGGGSTHSRMAFKVNANDIALANLTVTNLTAQDAFQAEALMIESSAARLIVDNCSIDSYQDTILANVSTSKAYFKDSLIQGDVDFIWGGGNLFFTNCDVLWLTRAAGAQALGPNPSPSATDINSNGFSFINCALQTLSSATPFDVVGRTRSITNGNTALMNCFVSTNIGGWFSDASPVTEFRNWYYNCTNDFGSTVTLSNGIALSGSDPNVTLASSSTNWLYGWLPQLAPLITSQPVGASVTYGQSATFTANAMGIPDIVPANYQWLLNGAPINGATGPSYTIASAVRTNGGNYTVIINNGYGSVTSSVAVLTYIDTPPVAPSFSVGALLGITETIPIVGGPNTPTDVDGDILTVTGVVAGANGTVTTDGANAIYTATGGASDSFTYTVSDGHGGTATGTVSVTINSAAGYNLLSAAPTGSGTNVISFLGIPVYNYALDATTNLTPPVNWVPQTTNPANLSGVQTYTNVSAQSQIFYRARQTH